MGWADILMRASLDYNYSPTGRVLPEEFRVEDGRSGQVRGATCVT